MMFLCVQCLSNGFCRRRVARLVTDAEIANPEFVRDVRRYAASLRISPDHWRERLTDFYRDFIGIIVNAANEEVALDMEQFEAREDSAACDGRALADNIRYWFRDFCRNPEDGVQLRVRTEAWERVRILASILRARDPDASRFWGLRAANDNRILAYHPS